MQLSKELTSNSQRRRRKVTRSMWTDPYTVETLVNKNQSRVPSGDQKASSYYLHNKNQQ